MTGSIGGMSSSQKKKAILMGNVYPSGHMGGRIYSAEGICPAIKLNHGDVIRVAIRQDGSVSDCKTPRLEVVQGAESKGI